MFYNTNKGKDRNINQLADAVTAKEKSKGQLHKVFEESFDAKSIDNQKFFSLSQQSLHCIAVVCRMRPCVVRDKKGESACQHAIKINWL